MISTLLPVAIQDDLSLKTQNTTPSALPATERSPDVISLKNIVSISRRIGDSNNTYANSLPVELMLPVSTNKILPSATKAELAQRLTDAQQGRDIDTIEHAVAGVASLCGAQILSGMDHPLKRSENDKTGREAVKNTTSRSTEPARSHPEVDAGTDITAVNRREFRYSNVMGNMGILAAFTDILQVLNRQEAHFNTSAAQWSQFAMGSAHATGQHLISASKENMTGAIVGGALSIGGGVTSTGVAIKAFKRESKSINNNLNRSHQSAEKAELSKNSLQQHKDKLVGDGLPVDNDVAARLGQSYERFKTESITLNNRHQQVSNSAMKNRVIADGISQVNRPTNDIIQGGYGVSSAEQSKEAEIMRANQTVSGEVDNVHQQTAKKSSEGESALRQALLTILNNNNDAVSAISSRMA